MNGAEAISSIQAAFVIGMVTSVHCVGMCGPLACATASIGRTPTQRQWAAGSYHFGRLLSYAILGAIAGAVGQQPLRWLLDSPAMVLPWILIAVLVIIAFGMEKRMPCPAFLSRLTMRLRLRLLRGPSGRGGFAVGVATPLLPCAPLWIVLIAALASGSTWRGTEMMAAFALGTIPLLWITQGGWVWVRGRMGVRGLNWTRRALALLTAGLLTWRMRASLWFIESDGAMCCGA